MNGGIEGGETLNHTLYFNSNLRLQKSLTNINRLLSLPRKERKHLHIVVHEDVYHALKFIALSKGISVNRLVNECILQYILKVLGYEGFNVASHVGDDDCDPEFDGRLEDIKSIEAVNGIYDLISDIEVGISLLHQLEKLSRKLSSPQDFQELKEIGRKLSRIDRMVNLILNDKQVQKKLKKLRRRNRKLIDKLLDKIDEYTQLKHTILKNNHNIIRLLKKL